jgi:hypothetical protein
MQLSDVVLPETAAVAAAQEVAARYCSPALLHHSIRSWAWARGFSEVLGIPVADPEALAVAALLHDVGLVDVFDAARVPFETAGGHVGWVLTAGAGWSVARRERVVEIIERHMQPEVDPHQDPDGHLLEIATALDISGRRADVLPPDLVAAVLRAHPRGTLGAEFGACLLDQAVRKPSSQAARLVSSGLLERLATHPLER